MKLAVTITPNPVKRGEKASVRVVVEGDASVVKEVVMSYPLANISLTLDKLDERTYGGTQVIPRQVPPGEYELIFTAKDALGRKVAETSKRVGVVLWLT